MTRHQARKCARRKALRRDRVREARRDLAFKRRHPLVRRVRRAWCWATTNLSDPRIKWYAVQDTHEGYVAHWGLW